jgi:hypothetical protein
VRITQALTDYAGPWDQARAGIGAFLDACTHPEYQAVVLKEGPAAIGWQRQEVSYSARGGDIVRREFGEPPLAALPVECLTHRQVQRGVVFCWQGREQLGQPVAALAPGDHHAAPARRR